MMGRTIIFTIAYLLLCMPIYAQFMGGEGAGTFRDDLAVLDCNFFTKGGDFSGVGSIVQPKAIVCNSYFGDSGSGYLNLELKREMECNMYMGDSVSGYTKTDFKRVIECNMYMGESHSGAYLAFFENPYKCLMYTASLNAGSGFHVRALSQDTLICEVIPLGMDCSPLQGEVVEGKGVLNWHTLMEYKNSGFELYKSYNGSDWDRISWLSGQGSSYDRVNYQYVDKHLTYSGAYYKFKQLDFDGNEFWSNIVFLKAGIGTVATEQYTVFPNPSLPNNAITLKAWNGVERLMNIEIYDGMGRLVWNTIHRFNSSDPSVDIPAGTLTAGSYYLKLTSEDDELEQTLPFIIFN